MPSKVKHRVIVPPGDYTIKYDDEYVSFPSNISSACTVTLPTVATDRNDVKPTLGAVLEIADEWGRADTYPITIAAASGELINGAATQIINVKYGFYKLQATPAGWIIITKNV